MKDEASLKPASRTRSEAGQQLRSEPGSHLRSKSSDRSAVGGGITGASEPEGRPLKIIFVKQYLPILILYMQHHRNNMFIGR